jgi:acyl carrier protein
MSDELISRALDVIAKAQHIPREAVTLDKTFQDLKIDSLDAMTILFEIESEFDISIPEEQAASIRSVREMVEGIAALLAAKQVS